MHFTENSLTGPVHPHDDGAGAQVLDEDVPRLGLPPARGLRRQARRPGRHRLERRGAQV